MLKLPTFHRSRSGSSRNGQQHGACHTICSAEIREMRSHFVARDAKHEQEIAHLKQTVAHLKERDAKHEQKVAHLKERIDQAARVYKNESIRRKQLSSRVPETVPGKSRATRRPSGIDRTPPTVPAKEPPRRVATVPKITKHSSTSSNGLYSDGKYDLSDISGFEPNTDGIRYSDEFKKRYRETHYHDIHIPNGLGICYYSQLQVKTVLPVLNCIFKDVVWVNKAGYLSLFCSMHDPESLAIVDHEGYAWLLPTALDTMLKANRSLESNRKGFSTMMGNYSKQLCNDRPRTGATVWGDRSCEEICGCSCDSHNLYNCIQFDNKKIDVQKRSRGTCETPRCNNEAKQIHHRGRDYSNPKDITPFALLDLCKECHMQETKRRRKYGFELV